MTDAPISWQEQKAREKEAAMEMRRQWIAEGLAHYGTAAKFADVAGLDRSFLYRHMDQFGFDRPKRSRNRDAEYARCAAEGMTQAEAARHLGVDRSTVTVAAQRLGLKFKPAPQGRPPEGDKPKRPRRVKKPLTLADVMANYAKQENEAMRKRL